MNRRGRSHTPRALFAILFLTVLPVAGLGCGGDERDQALDALERASQAAGLEAQMAALVGELPDEPSEQQASQAESELEGLDSEAENLLASADTGTDYDQQISTAVEETRGAGERVAAALEQPKALGQAKTEAVARLQESNQALDGAVEEIGTELADDEGNLSASDAEALEGALAEVEGSGEAVAGAGEAGDAVAGGCVVNPPHTHFDLIVEVEMGDLSCNEATEVFEKYYAPSVFGSEHQQVSVGEWSCNGTGATHVGALERLGTTAISTCTRESDGARIVTRFTSQKR